MSFEIITDSSCNLPDDLIDKYMLHVLSLVFRVNDKEYYSYIKGEKTELAQFYAMMRRKEHITTSLINPEVCRDMAIKLLDEGKDILYIGFSSALSATYQAVHITLEELKSSYPDRKILSVDTLGASLGQGLLVHHAVQLRNEGKTIEEIYQWLILNRFHLCHWFTVDDLFFLKRGGRISATTAIVGSMLGIKPILHMDNEGRLINVSKVRGRQKSLDALVERMAKTAIDPEEQVVFISHGDCIDDAKYVEKQIRDKLKVKDVLINYVDPVIGAHSGPGTIALFFLGTER